MAQKNDRLETLRMLFSSQELCSQEDVLRALRIEGFNVTQATLSRDMKQLKVAKAAMANGKYIYVLPTETMYKRVQKPMTAREMLLSSGFVSITFSRNMGVIRTRPGYASSIAYNIDNSRIKAILGTIAGDDTIFIVLAEDAEHSEVIDALSYVIPDIK
ncbi:MAG: arginine repressor [Bacteroidales bacterium]|nr:arginine repressor [Bacteroidales bacterium]MDY3674883.1 arginine repressor [Prevotella sp.]MCI7038740.1 arginine repressor [Bacteroidales bacterium]MCI7561348.1 arginine repressor [Bacteroidales bacterium]MDD7105308.1 arginine repressor [Bacteroidales bacterium]